MKKLLLLATLAALSLLLFVAVFSLVHRPLVVGEIQSSLDYKLGYASRLGSPKLVILAGSNGRYSHRCEDFSSALGLPCVNASIGVGIGLDFLLDQWRPLLQRGDVVYLPLEYGQYRMSTAEMQGGLQNALLVHHHRDYLWSLGWRRVAAAYGSFDLPFLVHGLVEMTLSERGFRRRSSTASLTPQGDERDHTVEQAAPYAALLRSSRAEAATVPERSDAIAVLETFLAWSRAQGVTVVGGLPTVPDAVDVASADVERLRRLYARHGQRFLALPTLSRYPLGCFYDALYHLHEGCQHAHSVAIAAALLALQNESRR
ncbi:MAG TPA: hypothetical protein VLI72_15410 [Methylibium sp.]|nr:hypothetical protein [Methylibium sp.]